MRALREVYRNGDYSVSIRQDNTEIDFNWRPSYRGEWRYAGSVPLRTHWWQRPFETRLAKLAAVTRQVDNQKEADDATRAALEALEALVAGATDITRFQ